MGIVRAEAATTPSVRPRQIPGPLVARGAVNPLIRDADLPVQQVFVLLLKTGELPSLEAVVLRIADAALRLAFVPRRARLGRQDHRAVVLSEGEQLGVEIGIEPVGARYRGLQVVDDQCLGHAAEVPKRVLQARRKSSVVCRKVDLGCMPCGCARARSETGASCAAGHRRRRSARPCRSRPGLLRPARTPSAEMAAEFRRSASARTASHCNNCRQRHARRPSLDRFAAPKGCSRVWPGSPRATVRTRCGPAAGLLQAAHLAVGSGSLPRPTRGRFGRFCFGLLNITGHRVAVNAQFPRNAPKRPTLRS